MTPHDEERLGHLLLRWRELATGDGSVTPEEFCSTNPELVGEFKRRIAGVPGLDALLASTAEPPTRDDLPSSEARESVSARTEFSDPAYHARGGLGVIYRAKHAGLGRAVALKFLKPSRASDPGARRRFGFEAEVLARLEHPGVVPIYALRLDEPEPWYAMRFVEGRTLDDAIREFHVGAASWAGDGMERSPGFRSLLGRFVSVCNTVAYAHGRGLIHRDLKPVNIMVGPFDETLVMDWGLAKDLNSNERDEAVPGLPEAHDDPSGTFGVIGTPAFMSPEQAAGDHAAIGPASDIYALGAILYAILTGRAAITGPNLPEVIAKAKSGDFPRPGDVNPASPKALEAVCLKAMSKNLTGRYQSALDVAREVDRWLAGDPVSAWPEPWTRRAARVISRHRTAAAAGVGLVFAGTVATLVAAVLLSVEKDATARERDKANDAAGLATKEARNARAAEAEARRLLAASYADAGRLASQRGAWIQAVDGYDKAAASGGPDTIALKLGRLDALMALNRDPEALAEVRALASRADLGAESGRVWLRQADLGHDKSMDAKAKENLIRKALAAGLPPAEEAYASGLLATSSPEAVAHFRRALELDPFHQRAGDRLMNILMFLGRKSEARSLIERNELLFPDDPSPKLLGAIIDALDGDLDAADRRLEATLPQIGRESVDQWKGMARVARKINRLDDIQKLPGATMNAKMMNYYLSIVPDMLRVTTLLNSRSEAAGATAFDFPPYLSAAYGRIFDAMKTKLFRGNGPAIREAEALVKAHPEGAVTYFLAALLHDEGRFEDCARVALQAADMPAVMNVKRYSLFYAVDAQRELLLRPNPPPELQAATAKTVRRLLDLGDIEPNLLPSVAVAAAISGDIDLARPLLIRWRKAAPKDRFARLMAASVEWKVGNAAGAIAEARSLLKEKPNDQQAKELHDKARAAFREQSKLVGDDSPSSR